MYEKILEILEKNFDDSIELERTKATKELLDFVESLVKSFDCRTFRIPTN